MVDGSAPAADSDEYQGWVASMQGGGSGLPRDEVFKFPWDNVVAWCARFPPRAGSPAGCAFCQAFCAKFKDATCRATASKHVASMCANMHHRNVRQPMTSTTAQRVVSELRAAGYPVPQWAVGQDQVAKSRFTTSPPPDTDIISALRLQLRSGQLRLPLRLYDHPVHITLTFLLIVNWGLLPVPLVSLLILAWAGIPVSQTCQT